MTEPDQSHHEPALDQAAWEARYSAKEDGIWSGKPNAVLVAEVEALAPGTALDVGCGEGGDALWLASHGWQVTGVDISTVALGRAAAHGTAQGLEVEWRHVDLIADPPEAASFDLVSAHFMQLPEPERLSLYRALAVAVAPGGTLLLVGHHPEWLPAGTHRPEMLAMMFTPEQLSAELDLDRVEWVEVLTESRQRQMADPDGQEITVSDAILRARKA